MKADEIMTVKVRSVAPETLVLEAAQIMQASDIGFLPVCEEDKLVGAITDRDIVIRCAAADLNPEQTPCRDIMTTEVFYCYADQNILEIAAAMRNRNVQRMIILDRNNKLAGVISLGDIAKLEGGQGIVGDTLKNISGAA